ncbi:MAG: hypothetical protein QOH21_117 [Acidobacteriota bacterium]|nr:hypothetical protein [Acidobacteriota bacterium]
MKKKSSHDLNDDLRPNYPRRALSAAERRNLFSPTASALGTRRPPPKDQQPRSGDIAAQSRCCHPERWRARRQATSAPHLRRLPIATGEILPHRAFRGELYVLALIYGTPAS